MSTDSDHAYLGYQQTPLNACSIETCCTHPLHVEQDTDPVAYLPMTLGCYQLDKTAGKRNGRLDLFAVPVNSSSDSAENPAIGNFGKTMNILGDNASQSEPASGVLDGRWCSQNLLQPRQDSFQNYFASAHASGEILIHRVDSTTTEIDNATPQHPFQATLAGKSKLPSKDDDNPALCLALAWDQTSLPNDNGMLNTRIISCYSNGHVAIHRIRQPEESSNDNLEITLEQYWSAHKMFTAPAEVWCCAFVNEGSNTETNVVATGGDEGSWKLWDLRTPLMKPIYQNANDFGAGVTVISPHPRHSQLLAVGSYDETIALYDVRYLSTSSQEQSAPQLLFNSDSLGGGIWRCKWHPFDDNRLLVGAMHGGCRVLTVQGLECVGGDETKVNMTINQEFTEHKSMAYGADWLVYNSGETKTEDESQRRIEVAASCSFYDQAMYLWKTN